MKAGDLLISLMIHVAVLAAIIIFSVGTGRSKLPSLGPTISVGMTSQLPKGLSGPKMPSLNVPSAAIDQGVPKEAPVKLKSITEKEKVEKKSASRPKNNTKNTKNTNKPQDTKPKETPKEPENNDAVSGSGVELADVDGEGSMAEYYNGPLGEYYLSYNFGYVTSRINQNWNNPIRSNSPISCVIYFQITKSGDIQGVTVKKSSGNSLFDRYAEMAVTVTKKLPALPQSFPDNEVLAVNLTFVHRP